MSKQVTNHIFMVRPVAFRMNEQTAVNNYFQHEEEELSRREVQDEALVEFDAFVTKLKDEGVDVTVFEDSAKTSTPDSIFPNNWISLHEDGAIRLYPMFAENRRLERREMILDQVRKQFVVNEVVDYSYWEESGAFLEATGSLILDRQHGVAYAALSDRTMEAPIQKFCEDTGYRPVLFHALQTVEGARLPIYHTNVMMCVGESFSTVCLDSIDDEYERAALVQSLEQTGKEIVALTEEQKDHFAGNMLQLVGKDEQRIIAMSSDAFHSLRPDQKVVLEKHGKLVHSNLETIEKLGGGSARCMIAEIFNPLRNNLER